VTGILTYAVGDIHGSFTKLASLLRHCRAHCGANASRFIFVGDYVDRGRRSRDVVDLLMTMQSQSPGQIVCLRGNHEEMLINAAQHHDEELWLINGAEATLHSYGVRRADEIPSEHLRWFASLPFSTIDGKRFYVHAGIMPGTPLDQQRRDVMLWIREPFLSDPRDHGLYIVHGHTPLGTGLPEHLPNRLNIDTGAFFGGPLTAAVFDESAVGPLAFITNNGAVVRAPAIAELERSGIR